jgi:hypothetical protein
MVAARSGCRIGTPSPTSAPSGQKTLLTSGVCRRMSRMATMTAYCPPELATPRSAARAAGSRRSRHGTEP